MSNFVISAPARIHMNLLSMGYDGYRKNGGIGFSISGYDTVFEFSPSSLNAVADKRSLDFLRGEDLSALVEYLDRMCNDFDFKVRLSVSILEGPKAHSGLGVGTTTKLAIAEALLLVNKQKYSSDDVRKLSGRGGTSGIGINTYFSGGFVFDGGVKVDDQPFGPSASKERSIFKFPQVLIEAKMPAAWVIGLLQVTKGKVISGKKELEFFSKNTPIDRSAIEAACYQAVMGVSASIVEGDYSTFSKSINAIQNLTWKKAEWECQSAVIFEGRDWLIANQAASVGLSSFGPSLYFTHDTPEKIFAHSDLPNDWKLKLVSPDNFGRVISYV